MPDLAVEILFPRKTVHEISMKLRFALKQDLRLGWLIHPIKKPVYVFKARRRVLILKVGMDLSGEEVLPGYRLSLETLFSWVDED